MLLKYHNNINKLKIWHFTANEIDIFFSLLLKVKETDEHTIVLTFSELKKMAQGDKNQDRFINNILGLSSKLKSLNQIMQDCNGDYVTFSLFGDIITSPGRSVVIVPINPRFRYLINDIISNFTIIDLKQLISLRGGYSKTLYRLLKQFDSTCVFQIKIDEFKEIMGIPQSYAMFTIRQKVLKPCLEQLKKYFKDLTLEENKSGRSVTSLKFYWKKNSKEKEIKAIVKKYSSGEKELQEHMKKLEEEKEVPPTKTISIQKEIVTREEFEKLYYQHLKDHNVDDNPILRRFFAAKYKIKEV